MYVFDPFAPILSYKAEMTHYASKAAILASITLLQTWIYPRAPGQRLSTANHFVVTFALVVFATNLFSVITGSESAIDLLYILSYFKLYVSVAKYIPQVNISPPTNDASTLKLIDAAPRLGITTRASPR